MLVATFDRVTGRDSVLLHGQVRPVREPFFDAFNGRSFMAPPNRPHDREMLVGVRERHRMHWADEPLDDGPAEPSRARQTAPTPMRRASPGRVVRRARNLRAGDVLVAPGRPRIAHVSEGTGGRIQVRTDRGLLLYFAAGAAIGVFLSSEGASTGIG